MRGFVNVLVDLFVVLLNVTSFLVNSYHVLFN